MEKYMLFLSSMLLMLNCSSTQEKTYESIKFPYELISNDKNEVRECLDMTNTRGCERISWELSITGEYYKAIECWNVTNQRAFESGKDSAIDLKEYKIVPAKEKLLKLIENRKVVMFNEAHHLPNHRITTMSYLEELYQEGFRYLGVEGLREDGNELMKRKQPKISSGYYIKEPQYSNLIKKAISIGYVVFNYDVGGQRKEREINQANKIAEIFEKDSLARVLIHAGWGHIREDSTILNGLMAFEFKKRTGIDPLTINQTRFNEQSKKVYEHFIYQKLKPFDVPSLLVRSKDQKIYTDSITDIILFHPRTEEVNGRPDYLKNSNLFYSKIIRFDKYIQEELLIIVYDKNEQIPLEERTAIEVAIKKKGAKELELFFPFKRDFIIYTVDSLGIIRNITHI